MMNSIIILRSKIAFKDWISSVCKNDPLQRNSEVIYPLMEESVWLIPSIGSFDDSMTFDNYIESLKPILLAQEIQRILKNVSTFEGDLSASQFDEFFSIEIRSHVADINALNDWKPYLDKK